MKINHNMSAVITNAQLLHSENSLAASMERLSSGLKINHAKDDPAGVAISNKMQAQIDGLDQASQNASNGISVLQIADTALSEITSMLQRIRELSVQAASDTTTLTDRESIQAEVDKLKEEVDRISRDTEYNTKTLLDGSSDTRVYADGISRMAISDHVSAGNYKISVADIAKQSSMITATDGAGKIPAGILNINGVEVNIEEGEDAASVFAKIRQGAERADVQVFVPENSALNYYTNATTGGYKPGNNPFAFGDSLVFATNGYGDTAKVDITADNAELSSFLGLDTATAVAGQDMKLTLDTTSDFSAQATASVDGNRVKITDVSGFEMDFMIDAGLQGDIDIEVTDIGTMTLQIGANEHQTMQVRIPEISSKSLYIDGVDVTKLGGPDDAISTLDDAIAITSNARSMIGAYQNRLEYAVESLDASSEDMNTAISRIQDVDMAKEMTEYTKYNVLQQAGISVLSQANDVPQMVLQLLQ